MFRLHLLGTVLLLLLVPAGTAATDSIVIHPTQCADSGGDCVLSNVQVQDGTTEQTSGHPSQTRFIRTVNDNRSAVTQPDRIDSVFAEIDRFESNVDPGATIRLAVTRPSDGTTTTCALSVKTTNNNVYNQCNVTDLVRGSSTPEADAENLTLNYRSTGLGSGSKMNLDHSRVVLTYEDTTPPAVTLDHPADDAWTNTTTVDFNYSVNDTTSRVAACSLRVDGSVVKTDTTVSEGAVHNLTHTLSGEGGHVWSVNCTDTSANANTGSSPNRTINLDTTKPRRVSFHPPTPANDSTVTNATQTFNVSYEDNLAAAATCTLVGDGTDLASTVAANDTATTITHTLADGVDRRFHVRCADNATNTNRTQDRVVTVDSKPPSFRNVTYAPNDQSTLDPNTNVTVEANVTDAVSLDTVILMYRNISSAAWQNVSMQQEGSTDIFNATFNATTEDTWQFRLWANDSSGQVNRTVVTNVSVDVERTWTQANTVPDSYAVVRSDPDVFAIGNITLNNTGDVPINFSVDSSRAAMSFNGSKRNPLFATVEHSGDRQVNVTFNKSGLSVGEYPFTINISASEQGGGFLSWANITGRIIVQNVQGPWLDVSITSFDNTVTQGDSGIDMAVEVANEGTGDADDTWLAWDLPAGWTVTSGALNTSQNILFTGDTMTNTVTVDVGGKAPTGTQQLFAESAARGNETGAYDNTPRAVTVRKRATSSGTSSGTTGGGSGILIGLPPNEVRENLTRRITSTLLSDREILRIPAVMDVVRGQNASYNASITNIINDTRMVNATIAVESGPRNLFRITPQRIRETLFGEERRFAIDISAPAYLEQGQRIVTFVLNGQVQATEFQFNRSFTRRRTVELRIHTVSRDTANSTLARAQQALQQLQASGFGTRKSEQALQTARDAMAAGDYDRAHTLAQEVLTARQQAQQVQQEIDTIQARLGQYPSWLAQKLDVRAQYPEAQQLVRLAAAAVERQDYETAQERVRQASLAFEAERQQFDPVFFLLEWWWALLLGAAGLVTTAVIGHRIARRRWIARRIQELNAKERTILSSMREAQTAYYQDDGMGADTFRASMDQYEEELAELQQERTTLREQRIRLLQPEQVREALAAERETITESLKELQESYFGEHAVSKHRYDRMNEIYRDRLGEIEREQARLDVMQEGGVA